MLLQVRIIRLCCLEVRPYKLPRPVSTGLPPTSHVCHLHIGYVATPFRVDPSKVVMVQLSSQFLEFPVSAPQLGIAQQMIDRFAVIQQFLDEIEKPEILTSTA